MSTTRPEHSASIEVQPAFYDVDPMFVVWHGHYLKYFELARSALMSKLDYDYLEMAQSGFVWPVVEARLKYVKPARLKQRLQVQATIVEYELRLKVEYLITELASGLKLTKGYTVQVAVNAQTQELRYSSPPVLLRKLGVLP